MAHDEELAERIRLALGAEEPEEKRMFGGIGFMVDGNLAVAASGQGGLLVRVDPDQAASLLTEPGTSPMLMRGSEMKGWLRVETGVVREGQALDRWIDIGVRRARGLAAK